METVKAEPKQVVLTSLHTGELPTNHRKITDLVCLLVFLAFWVIGIFAMLYGFNNGVPRNIAAPFDSSGNRCDNGPTRGYPYLYFNGTLSDKNRTVCVASCPTSSIGLVPCYPNQAFPNCSVVYPHQTYLLARRFCLSTNTTVADRTRSLINGVGKDAYITDITDSWYVLLIAIILSVILGYAYVYMLETCAGIVIGSLISVFFVGVTALGFLFLRDYLALARENPLPKRAKLALAIAITLWSVGFLLMLSILCLWSKLRIAINVVESAAVFVKEYSRVVIVPIAMLVVLVLYLIFWIVVALYIFSVGNVEYVQGRSYGLVKWSVTTRLYWYFHVFTLFWNTSFILAISSFVITTTACVWYFAPDRKNLGSPIAKGFAWAFIYHMGTLAMGSILVAIAWIFQILFGYLYQRLNAKAKAVHSTPGFMLNCAVCVVSFYERFIKYINRHAYIETALKSNGFCTASYDASTLIINNSLKFGIVHGLASLVIFFGNLGIAIVTTIASYWLIQLAEIVSDGVFETNSPLILCFLVSYVIAALLGHVFDISADVIIHCYMIDQSMNFNKAIHSFPGIQSAMEYSRLKMAKQLKKHEDRAHQDGRRVSDGILLLEKPPREMAADEDLR